jgi:hypothetical protein
MLDYRESAPRIARIANAVAYQLSGSGVHSMTRDDVEQELWIVWCMARDKYDPSLGVPFEAFLINGIKMHIRSSIKRKAFKRAAEEWGKSLDAPVSKDEGGATVGETIAEDFSFMDDIEAEGQFQFIVSRLTERAATFVRLLRDQPQILIDALKALEERSNYAKELGVSNMLFRQVTTSMIFKLMGCDRPERTRILAEVRQVTEKELRKLA